MKLVNTRKTNVVHTVELTQEEIEEIKFALGEQPAGGSGLYTQFKNLLHKEEVTKWNQLKSTSQK